MAIRFSFPFLIIVAWFFVALFAGILPLHPDAIMLNKILVSPELHAWLGYDDLGRSIAERLIMGARTSFLVAMCVVSISFFLGTVVGVMAAWFGGWCDKDVDHKYRHFIPPSAKPGCHHANYGP